MPTPERIVSAVSPQVVRHILKLPSGSYLAEFDPLGGAIETVRKFEAKIFWSLRTAQASQKVFGGEVLPAPLEFPKDYLRDDPEPPRTAAENIAACLVEASGNSVFAGLQRGFKHGTKDHPTLVLWNSRLTRTTLGAAITEVSSDKVRDMTAESDRRFLEGIPDEE